MDNNKENLPKKKRKNYLKYSGLAFQMIATLLLGTLVGYWLDNYLQTTPLFLIVFLLLSVAGSMYLTVKELL